jgi:hypothetical protein
VAFVLHSTLQSKAKKEQKNTSGFAFVGNTGHIDPLSPVEIDPSKVTPIFCPIFILDFSYYKVNFLILNFS